MSERVSKRFSKTRCLLGTARPLFIFHLLVTILAFRIGCQAAEHGVSKAMAIHTAAPDATGTPIEVVPFPVSFILEESVLYA
jgi:hypothetical protein